VLPRQVHGGEFANFIGRRRIGSIYSVGSVSCFALCYTDVCLKAPLLYRFSKDKALQHSVQSTAKIPTAQRNIPGNSRSIPNTTPRFYKGADLLPDVFCLMLRIFRLILVLLHIYIYIYNKTSIKRNIYI